jgi:hypothetical protein
MIPEEIASNLFLNLVFPDETIPNTLDRERVIVVIDQTTMTQVNPKPREKIEAASYRTRIPSGVPEILMKSNSVGMPKAQITTIENGTTVVVRISTAMSQFLSLGNRPGLANL